MHINFEVCIEELHLFEKNEFRAVMLNVKLTADTDVLLNVDLHEHSIEVECDNGKLGKEAKSKWLKLDLEEPEDKALASLIIKAIERDYKDELDDRASDAILEREENNAMIYQEDD